MATMTLIMYELLTCMREGEKVSVPGGKGGGGGRGEGKKGGYRVRGRGR